VYLESAETSYAASCPVVFGLSSTRLRGQRSSAFPKSARKVTPAAGIASERIAAGGKTPPDPQPGTATLLIRSNSRIGLVRANGFMMKTRAAHATARAGNGAGTVRFASIVAAAGQPEIYLPLLDPKHDRAFMKAVKEARVLTVKQEPTSTRADFGVVGFDEGRHVTYLLFPRSLKKFADARIVGIHYDDIKGSVVSRGRITEPRHSARQRATPKARRVSVRKSAPPKPPKPLKPPKPPKPAAKQFRVRVRIRTTNEEEFTVSALTQSEAKQKAEALAWDSIEDASKVTVRALQAYG
jgi:hypothetical protein